MTLVIQMPEKDVILGLLKEPYPESKLYQMSSTELEGLKYGIDRLAVIFRSESKPITGLSELIAYVKSAENYVNFMASLDESLERQIK